MRVGAPVISLSLTKVLHFSIDSATFPDIFKCARIVPIYKGSGNVNEMSNYRPISILPAISKVLENHIHCNVYKYLTDRSLLYETQSGFRKHHSCQTALLRICDDLLQNIDNGRLSGVLFLDLSKAFDLVNHGILLKKLSLYGLQGKNLNWFKSYLSDRSQIVCHRGKTSESQKIMVGVPQGSILGPLLFTIFINDLPLSLTCNSHLDMYADDQTLLSSGLSISQVNNSLQNDAVSVNNWVKNNGMIINASKT